VVVDDSVDALERLRDEVAAPNVFYLLGDADVLPLMDDSVDEVVASGLPSADELFRVLRAGGRTIVSNPDTGELERLFADAGFTAVTAADDLVTARKP
jgi:ubiquinone/menaquinone biosynthesis C-methylase UbiE